MTPAKDAAEAVSDSPAAESPSLSDAADDLVARLAGASISPAPAPSAAVAMSMSAAPSPSPSTPMMRSRGMGACAASPAAAPPSPALEVRTRVDARAFGTKKVDYEASSGTGYRASLVCNFKSQSFTLTPETPQAGVAKLVIPLCEVKTYTLTPGLHRITLTLNAAIAASPAARTSLHDVLGKDLSFRFSTIKSYQEVADELEKTLVFRQGTFENDFELVHTASIGRGGNGAVFLVRRRGSPPDSIKFAEKRAHKLTTDLTREAEIHRLCADCPFITKLVEFYDSCGPGSQQHLIMELMEGGDLMHDVLLLRKEMYMDSGAGTLWMTDAEVRIVTWRVLKALQFMHSLSPDGSSVLHRDLKPDNIMLALRGPDGCGDCASAKVADLGHAKELVGVSQTYTSSGIGTVEYMPPEIAAAILQNREIGHNKALDMWTVGVLVFVCFMQEFPFGFAGDANNPHRQFMMTEIRKRVLSQGLQGTGPEALRELFPPGSPKAALLEQRNPHGRVLMQMLMQREPAQRWRVEDALSSPWFAGIEEEQGAGSEQ